MSDKHKCKIAWHHSYNQQPSTVVLLQAHEKALLAKDSELAALQQHLADDRQRAHAEVSRLDSAAREALLQLREAEQDFLTGQDKLAELRREVSG